MFELVLVFLQKSDFFKQKYIKMLYFCNGKNYLDLFGKLF